MAWAGDAITSPPPFTPRAKKVLELSLREALHLGNKLIGTEHLLLGLVREGDGVGARVLVSLGADLNSIRQGVYELSGQRPSGEVSSAGPIGGRVRRSRRGGPMRELMAKQGASGASSFVGPAPMLVRCSFCGRQPPDSGRLVQGQRAFICEHCITEWGQRLTGVAETEHQGVARAKPYEPEDEGEGSGDQGS